MPNALLAGRITNGLDESVGASHVRAMEDDLKPRYRWKETTAGDGREDYLAFDGDRPFGRIFLETARPTKGKWRWSGQFVREFRQIAMPNNGWEPSARLVAKKVEDRYDQLLDLHK